MESLKNHSYQPNPVRREYINKSNGKKRPLGIPSFDDKLVQEVIRMIIESIYEPTFSNKSHGFRPERSCHTAIKQIKNSFIGTKWFIEGDIKSFFDNIDHNILIGILRKRIQDEYFISLIYKFLKAGYLENWVYYNTYSGTPQGSIISPILSNIYLNELDKYMEDYTQQFNKGKARQRRAEYKRAEGRVYHWRHRYSDEEWKNLESAEKDRVRLKVKGFRKEMLNTQRSEPQDNNFKRLLYTRYADDWICGVIGSKEDAENIKEDIKEFLYSNLKLELSEEKTLITHSGTFARFLGYDIVVSRNEATIKTSKGVNQRLFKDRVYLYVPKEKWLNKLIDYKALRIKYIKDKGNKETYKPMHRTYLINNDDLEILNQYNAEIRGLYNYYRLADNATVLSKFYFIMRGSLFKTYAAKYRSTSAKERKKRTYIIDGKKRYGVKYKTQNGEKTAYFYNDGFKKNVDVIKDKSIDNLSKVKMNFNFSSLIKRLNAKTCEWCGSNDVDIEIHHVRKLKNLSGKKHWEKKMIANKRKTMALCIKCHHDLHNGKLD